MMGWDQPLQYHFMIIEYVAGDDEPLYSNLEDEHAGFGGRVGYFANRARSLGIEIPVAMLARLQTDEVLNLGNASSIFDATGVESEG